MQVMADLSEEWTLLFDLGNGMLKQELLRLSCKWSLFDLINDLGGSASDVQIAESLGFPREGVTKFLDSLTGLKLLEKKCDRSKDDALYSNSSCSQEFLTKGAGTPFKNAVFHLSACQKRVCENAELCISKGLKSDDDVFTNIIYKEDNRELFLDCMNEKMLRCRAVVSAFDLSEYKSAVDLGGSSGAFARELKRLYPNMDVAVCELPNVVAMLRDTCEDRDCFHYVEGDFFVGGLPPSDLYVLGQVLHDWNDEKCKVILRNVYRALNPGGAVLILERLLTDDHTGYPDSLVSLRMYLYIGGTERTKAEFQALLEEAGFSHFKAITKSEKNYGHYQPMIAEKL